MFLSRIQLDINKTDTMRALASPNRFHGAIESSAQRRNTRKLWRIDNLRGNKYLLILSENNEDWSDVVRQFGSDETGAEVKEYDLLLNKVEKGSKWHFLLTANPTIAKKTDTNSKTRGKIMAHTTEAYQKKWLMDKSVQCGFLLSEDDFFVSKSQWYQFYKGNRLSNHYVRLLAVTFEGILTVDDVERFKYMLTHGIGREKAYGMGMLTIIR